MNADPETPIVFSPITDPIEAKIEKDWKRPGMNATGTSDMVPMDELIDHLLLLAPEAKKVGMIFNDSQANSVIQWQAFEAEAKKRGLEPVAQTINSTNDVASATRAVADKVDALVLPTDNDVASSIPIIAEVVRDKQLPTLDNDVAHLDATLATFGVDFKAIGEQSGHMAARILKGEDEASETPIERADTFRFDLNETMFNAFDMDPSSIHIPDDEKAPEEAE